jgi:hypothetical protein
MSYSKVIQIGSAGSLNISESAGLAKVSLQVSEKSAGSFPGVASASVSAEVDVSVVSLVDAALGLASAKWPQAAGLIAGLQAIVDAELAKA